MYTKHITSLRAQSVEQQFAHAQCQGHMILVVEDEEAVREFVRMALEHAGYSVRTAVDGDCGFGEFAIDPSRFALVITDVIMPNRTGTELVEMIRRERAEVPVIFMSAYTGGTGSSPIDLPPGTTLLEKPFSLDQLLHAVGQAIPQHAPRN
jgi:two-component system, cell cycle response regulator CpdR